MLSLLKSHDYFAAVTGLHNLHSLVNAVEGEGMGDDVFQVQFAGFEDAARAIPGVKDAPPGDTQHGRAFEDDVVGKVKFDHAGWQAQQRDAAPVAQRLEALANGSRMARHLQHHIHAETIGNIENLLDGIDFTRVERIGCTHRSRQVEAFGIGFDGEDGTRARHARQANRPQPDGAAAIHRDRALRDFTREGGVYRVAERLLNRGHTVINFFACFPGHAFRDGDILGERAVAVNAQYLHIAADMRLAGATLVAMAAGDVGFSRHKIAGDKFDHFIAYLDHLARELVAEDARGAHAALRPCIPLVNVHIRAADRSRLHLH